MRVRWWYKWYPTIGEWITLQNKSVAKGWKFETQAYFNNNVSVGIERYGINHSFHFSCFVPYPCLHVLYTHNFIDFREVNPL
jgi:hypothetical protein